MKISFYTLLLILIFTSCKKQISKWPVYVTIKANMAHNEEPIAGIKWKIIEKKSSSSGQIFSGYETTGREFEGVTDDAGLAIANFKPRKGTNYSYDIFFDYSSMNVPQGNYEVVLGPNPFAQINRFDENYFEIRILPYMDIDIHYKNLSCFDENDIWLRKSVNIDEQPYVNINTLTLTTTTTFEGCVDHTSNFNKLAGRHVFKWEAIRNGIVETGLDTFYVEPGGNNLIEMHW